jgi:hypothetical protein
MAMEYAMVKGETPSTLVSYFNKAGQGLDATYRRAVEYFMGRNRRAPKDITEEAKAQQQSQSVPIGMPYFGYFINTETDRVLKNCITEPSLVKAMVNLVEREIWRETSSSTKSPGIASREAQRVIGKRPALQSQAYSASLPGPRAKSPPYRQGS